MTMIRVEGGKLTTSSIFKPENVDIGASLQINRPLGKVVSYLEDKRARLPQEITIEDIKRDRYIHLKTLIDRLFEKMESDFTPKQIVLQMKRLDETEHKVATKKNIELSLITNTEWSLALKKRHQHNSTETFKHFNKFVNAKVEQYELLIEQEISNKRLFAQAFLESNYDPEIQREMIAALNWSTMYMTYICEVLNENKTSLQKRCVSCKRVVSGSRISMRAIDRIAKIYVNLNNKFSELQDNLMNEIYLLFLCMDLPNCKDLEDVLRLKSLKTSNMNMDLVNDFLGSVHKMRYELMGKMIEEDREFCQRYDFLDSTPARSFRNAVMKGMLSRIED